MWSSSYAGTGHRLLVTRCIADDHHAMNAQTCQWLLRAGVAGLFALAGCSASSPPITPSQGVGVSPTLPAPSTSLIPTVSIAPAVGWPAGATPKPAAGLAVTAFATGLDHPRWIHVLPNGDVLVAESNGPPKDPKSLKAWAMKEVKKRAGAGVPSANRITLLRDVDGDGVAETRHVFLEGLNSPFGMALVGDSLYVANTDAILRFPYRTGDLRATGTGEVVVALPAGPINHHWTKNIIASADGRRLYATVGSNSNIAENGIEEEKERAAILEVDPAKKTYRVFASGLRNPNGLGWEPKSGKLWTVVNERDELGDDLVPDYLTSVKDGAFYGWPFSYYGQHVDTRVKPQRPDLVAAAVAPDFALGSHVAPLGLAFNDSPRWPEAFRSGAFVGNHGSWNRTPKSGYQVVFVSFVDGMPRGLPVEVLGGFVNAEGNAMGRPVGVAMDRRGGLLVADDVGNVIWRVGVAR
ncbi:hypothetical protein DSM104440_01566 [Usitatibacter palustris]|uniref:Pyrroloquinoline quinone-dependent pyranose dehydrogenase beta-propeller domain-containing protein n=2 Tax=Usitatibacter palustris TaxID=2732487 RepID=A0A6M4H572_9PROT|nr:hypothetical protein DSM104440_01566 [Usitatibacter palustris]